MVKYRTEHEDIRCTVKEGAQGQPVLWLELAGGDPIPSLPNVEIGLRFRPGVTLEQAAMVAKTINQHCESLVALIADVPVR